tara:strand:+ start:4874 stop:5851 length:978 start_codon:yes stop_codon:yes gene_type:complete
MKNIKTILKFLRVLLLPLTLLVQVLLWLLFFSLSIFPLLILLIYKKLMGKLDYNTVSPWRRQHKLKENIVFNRIDDISKIEGCNARNVQYRWKIFKNQLKKKSQTLDILDFGAGSLRETYYFCEKRHNVDAIDKNIKQSNASYDSYQWDKNIPHIGTDIIKEKQYDLILAFDVIEHLLDLDKVIIRLKQAMKKDGLIFATIPNRLAFFERLFSYQHKKNLKRNTIDKSGIPHVNFKKCNEWKDFLLKKVFTIKDHDMSMGFFVNDCFHGIFGIYSRLFIKPVWKRFDEEIFYPKWFMKLVHELDVSTKSLLRNRWGWNLFILGKK